MAKLVFASPTYGPVDPQALRSQRVAIMHAAANGHTWVADASPDRMKFDVARNASVQSALQSVEMDGAEYVFWCDSDVILPASAVTRLLSYGLDFVTGVYFQRVHPHWPLIAHFNEDRQSFNWISNWPPDTVAPIDGAGFGCLITSTKLLDAIGDNWFTYQKYSEDFDFCMKAKKLGYQLYVDTGVLCGHLADPVPVTRETFVRAHPEFFPANGGGDMNGGSREENSGGGVAHAVRQHHSERDVVLPEVR